MAGQPGENLAGNPQHQRLLKRLAIFPFLFFLAHTLLHALRGETGEVLWVCTISNLMLAVGMVTANPFLIRTATIWLTLGFPLWLWDVMLHGVSIPTTLLTHLGGLGVGLLALSKVRAVKTMWFGALGWYVVVQVLSRFLTNPELNVNVAHRMYDGWEEMVSSYWQFWLATTGMTISCLWVTNVVLVSLFPVSRVQPPSPTSQS